MTYSERDTIKVFLWIGLTALLIAGGVAGGLFFVWKVSNDVHFTRQLEWLNLFIYVWIPFCIILSEVVVGMVISTWSTWMRYLDPVTIDVLIPHLEAQKKMLIEEAEAEKRIKTKKLERKVREQL
jgi:hypothetical protein